LRIVKGPYNSYFHKYLTRLLWDANTEPDLSLYEIWRKIDNGNWSNIGTSTTNSYDDIDYFWGGHITLYYKIRVKDTQNKYSVFSNEIIGLGTIAPKVAGKYNNEIENIYEYYLSSNYPNPFNPSTVIHYEIPNDGLVTIKVYDELGREVKTLVNLYQNKGKYDINFEASQLTSGIYFYRLQSGSFVSTKKMLLLK